MLPEGDVPYTPNDAPVGTDHSRLEQEYRGLLGSSKVVQINCQTSRENLCLFNF